MSWLTRWFINNPVGANLLMFAIIASGVLAFGQLRVESFPQIAPSSISITTVYPGGSAQQIDESVTQRIEESISDIAGIKQITSESSAGMSSVVVQKNSSADLDALLDDIRNRVNAISGFPTKAEPPQVTRNEFTNLAAYVVISGARSDEALQPIAKQVEQALKKHPKISKVSNWGSRRPQLLIEVDPDALKRLGLSFNQVAFAIEKMSLVSRTGELVSDSGRMTIRGDGYADDVQKLKKLTLVSRPTGTVRLGDIAKIRRGYERSDAIVRNNGNNAIALLISTSQKDNLLHISQAIEQTLAQQRLLLPSDIELNTMADMAPYIEDQLGRLGTNAWQGLLIVIILLGIFLEVRLALWVAVGIPVAMAGTMASMYLTNYSINDITLFGFILVLGILVDDAVVVGEAIHEKRGQYPQGKQAAWHGVHSVAVATVFGVLTTIVAFSPMLWINNDFAKVLAGFSAVVIFALLFSLIESKFILPSHLAQLSNKPASIKGLSKIQSLAQAGLNGFNIRIYKPILERVLDYKWASLMGIMAFVILAYGMWSTGAIRSAFFPEIPGRYISVELELENGAPLPLQQQALTQIEGAMSKVEAELMHDYALSTSPIVNLLSSSNGHGSVEFTAELTSEALSQLPSNVIIDRWRHYTGPIEGAYSVQFRAGTTPAGDTVIVISAQDRELAKQVSHQLAAELRGLPGVADIYDDGQAGSPHIRLVLNEYGQQLGLTQATLADLAGLAFGEREIHRLLDQGLETKVLLQYPRAKRKTIEQLRQTLVPLENGRKVLLSDVAEFHFEQEPQQLHRRDREQVVNLYWKQNRAIQAPEQTLSQLTTKIETLKQ